MIPADKIRIVTEHIIFQRQFTIHYKKNWLVHLKEFLKDILSHWKSGNESNSSWIKTLIVKLLVFFSQPLVSILVKFIIVASIGLIIWYAYKAIKRSIVLHLESDVANKSSSRLITPLDWEREAEELCLTGKYLEAINALLKALILTFANKGVAAPHPGITNREYVNLLRERCPLQVIELVTHLVYLHEEKSYALRECGSDDFNKCLTIYNKCKMQTVS